MKGKKKTRLEKRLMAYTAAAVGALMMAPAAEAAIHYSGPKNLTVNPKNPVTIDLNGDGINDFSFHAVRLHESVYFGGLPSSGTGSGSGTGPFIFPSMSVSFAGLVALTETSNGNGGTAIIESQYYNTHQLVPHSTSTSTSYPFLRPAAPSAGPSFFFPFFYVPETAYLPAKLGTGYKIQNTLQNYSWESYYGILDFHVGVKDVAAISSTSFSIGNFKDKQTGCIGVRFKTDTGKQLYGWIKFQDTSAYTGVIKDWAYDDSGAPISACVEPASATQPVPVPALNQWGIMALIALLAGLSLKAIKEDKSKKNT